MHQLHQKEPGKEVTTEPEEPVRPEINPVTGDVVRVATEEPILTLDPGTGAIIDAETGTDTVRIVAEETGEIVDALTGERTKLL